VTRRRSPPRRHRPSPLSFHRQHHLLPPLTLSPYLCRADPQRGDDDGDAPTLPVSRVKPREEEETCPDATRTTTSRTPTPPTRLHRPTPPLDAGKPLAAPFFFHAGERHTRVADIAETPAPGR
jgi:hypothetical protein